MASIAWPNMFNSANTSLVSGKDAVKLNLLLLLNCEKMSLFGDPGFGSILKSVQFQQNDTLLSDLIIDEIYELIVQYLPQVFLTRNDITIVRDKTKIIARIKIIYRIDNTADLFSIQLTDTGGQI